MTAVAAAERPEASEALEGGPLAQSGGVAVYAGLPDAATSYSMLMEAYYLWPQATRQVVVERDTEEGRGGMPARALTNGPGSVVQDALYAAPWLHTFLSDLCGATIRPTSNRGTYSYYVEAGDYLDTHLEVVRCDVALITVLYDDTNPNDPAGGLAVFSDDVGTPLSRVRPKLDHAPRIVKAPVGSSIVLLGGLVPHRVIPIAPNCRRVISALCFEAHPPAR